MTCGSAIRNSSFAALGLASHLTTAQEKRTGMTQPTARMSHLECHMSRSALMVISMAEIWSSSAFSYPVCSPQDSTSVKHRPNLWMVFVCHSRGSVAHFASGKAVVPAVSLTTASESRHNLLPS